MCRPVMLFYFINSALVENCCGSDVATTQYHNDTRIEMSNMQCMYYSTYNNKHAHTLK